MRRTLFESLHRGTMTEPAPPRDAETAALVAELDRAALRRLGRSLAIRAVDAGSCNGCELEIQALSNPYYNLEGCNIRFVASPRHADLLLVSGPVAKNMAEPLRRVYAATPDPKRVVALGDCGCTGGMLGQCPSALGRVASVIPVHVAVPGCPPSPMRILQGILTAIEP